MHASANAAATTRQGSRLPPASRIAWGVLIIVGACVFVWHLAGNPLHDLALIRRAQVTIGTLTESQEVEHDTDRGVYYSDVGLYTYRIPDGREFQVVNEVPSGQLKEQEQVEYLPDKPAVSRIKGSGSQTITEWLGRWGLAGGLLLSMVCAGVFSEVILPGIREMKRVLAARRQSEAVPGQETPIPRTPPNPVADVFWKFLPFVLLAYLSGCLVLCLLTGKPDLSGAFDPLLGLAALALLAAVALVLLLGVYAMLSDFVKQLLPRRRRPLLDKPTAAPVAPAVRPRKTAGQIGEEFLARARRLRGQHPGQPPSAEDQQPKS